MSDPSLNPAPAPTLLTPTPEPAPTPPPAPAATTSPNPPPTPAPKADGTSPEKSLLNKEEPTAPQGAPEKYEAFKAPEGYEFDPATLGDAQSLFKTLNLSQDQAQKLMDLYAANSQKSADGLVEFWKAEQQRWVNEVTTDPQLGPRLAEITTNFSRAVDSVLGPQLGVEFKKAMDYTGVGNHPAFIRGMDKFVKLLSEGGHVQGKNPAPVRNEARPASAAAAMYPSLPSSQG